jgi:spore germination protein GerM
LNKRKAGILLAAVAVLAAVGISGFLLGRTQSVSNKTADKSSTKKSESNPKKDSPPDSKTTEPGRTAQTIVLYFSDSKAEYLASEEREVSLNSEADRYRAAVQALVEGPKVSGHYRTIPSNMTVQDVKYENGTVTINFGPSFAESYPQGSTGETMFLYSIVNTLTEFNEVRGVIFLAEGNIPAAGSGNYDLAQEFTRNKDLIP